MAPELWTDESEAYGTPVEVYAFAVLLYSLFVPEPMEQLDDGSGATTSPRKLFHRIKQGTRFRRVGEISEAYWTMITRCWQGSAHLRPSFQDIVDVMCGNIGAFLLRGADEAKVRDYISKMRKYQEISTINS
jgi:hypothetical protein